MIKVNPVSYSKAQGSVYEDYEKLKKAFGTLSLPVFFTYFGPFPEYLTFISDQLTVNLEEEGFIRQATTTADMLFDNTSKVLTKSGELEKIIDNMRGSAYFHNFSRDLYNLSLVNFKLAVIFIALREAVKGWAVGARKIEGPRMSFSPQEEEIGTSEDLIYSKDLLFTLEEGIDGRPFSAESSQELREGDLQIVRRSGQSLESGFLPKYLEVCSKEYKEHEKNEYYLVVRIFTEEMILALISDMPHIIYSPYNVIFSLTQKYTDFYEFIYLLSETLPTLAVQRFLFSIFIRPKIA